VTRPSNHHPLEDDSMTVTDESQVSTPMTGTADAASTAGATDAGRRQVLCGLALLGLGVPITAALAGCGSDATTSSSSTSGGSSAAPSTGGNTSAGTALVTLSQVPVGGGVVVDGPDGKVVVVQPTSGNVKAYNAACTHQGTTVKPPVDGVMTCPDHGSRFKASDGSVVKGPARTQLVAIKVKVKAGSVVLT
jgi:Rieske Fe-S protein